MRENDLATIQKMLVEITMRGWIENARPGNAGGVGNTLEDLLAVAENNLQLPDFGEWELKSQRRGASSLLTLFHIEPEPRVARVVPKILLLGYGWPHQEAGSTYPVGERSFRQTIHATSCSDRGFKVNVDCRNKRLYISFDFAQIDDRHAGWRACIRNGAGTGDISPNPFWSFDTLADKLKNKINNLLYFRAERKQEHGKEYFKYNEFEAFIDPDFDRFLSLIEEGALYVDFDARTGHNHGTKFRIRPSKKRDLYRTQLAVQSCLSTLASRNAISQ